MFKISLLVSLFYLFEASAADSLVPKFQFSFTMDRGVHVVDGEIVQNCRYEKFVISDSAQYVNDYRTYPLQVEVISGEEKDIYTVTNPEYRYHKITGWMKPTKECNALIKLNLKSSRYSAWLRHRPIQFTFRSQSPFGQSIVWDVTEISDHLEGHHMSFDYVSIRRVQVNIFLLTDGVREYWPPQTAAINPETGMPYQL